MGSRNSEHSGSMNFDELFNLIGHHYGNPQPVLALPAVNHDILFEEVVHSQPLSPETARRIREELQLIVDGGSARQVSGPSKNDASSKSSHHSKTKSTDSVTKKGNILTTVLEDLQDNFHVQNGILTVYVPKDANNENATSTEPIAQSEPHTQPQAPNFGMWTSIVTKNVSVTEARSNETAQIIFNEDGYATLKPPKLFLSNARKSWETSLTGHFIGGSFDFKFVRDHLDYGKTWASLEYFTALKAILPSNLQLLRRRMMFLN